MRAKSPDAKLNMNNSKQKEHLVKNITVLAPRLVASTAVLSAFCLWYWLLLHPQGRLERIDVPPAPVTQADYDQAHAQMQSWRLPLPSHH